MDVGADRAGTSGREVAAAVVLCFAVLVCITLDVAAGFFLAAGWPALS